MTTFSGEHAVSVFQCLTIASGLNMYRKHKMIPNRAYTPKAMMAAAERITGQKFKARDYEGAANALRALAEETRNEIHARMHEGSSITP